MMTRKQYYQYIGQDPPKEKLAQLRALYARIDACHGDPIKIWAVPTKNANAARILAGAIKDAKDRNKRKEAK